MISANTSWIGFDWEGLPEGSVVVDVGGGVGSQTLTLAQRHKHLKFVVQDTEATRPNAINVRHSALASDHILTIGSAVSTGMIDTLRPSLPAACNTKFTTSSTLNLSSLPRSSSCAKSCTTGPTFTASPYSDSFAMQQAPTPSS